MKNKKLYLVSTIFLILTACMPRERYCHFWLYLDCKAEKAYQCALPTLRGLEFEIRSIDRRRYKIYGEKQEKHGNYTEAVVEVDCYPTTIRLCLTGVEKGAFERYCELFSDRVDSCIELFRGRRRMHNTFSSPFSLEKEIAPWEEKAPWD